MEAVRHCCWEKKKKKKKNILKCRNNCINVAQEFIHNQCTTSIQPATRDIYLVVSSVAFAEVEDEPLKDELSDLRELGIDDGHYGGIDMGKDRRGALSLKHRPCQQTSGRHTHTHM